MPEQKPAVEAPLSYDEIVAVIRLLEASKFDSCELQIGGLRLTLAGRESGHPLVSQALPSEESQTPGLTAPPSTPAPAGIVASPREQVAIPEGGRVIRAPVVGTFYRAPEPGAEPFVQIGSSIEPDTTIGLIEVMKVFNTLKAGCHGKVERLLVADGDFVEFDQPLIVVGS